MGRGWVSTRNGLLPWIFLSPADMQSLVLSQEIMKAFVFLFWETTPSTSTNPYRPLVIRKSHCTLQHQELNPFSVCVQAEEERDDMEKVKLDNKRILFNLLPAHVAQHFLMSNPRNMVSVCRRVRTRPASSRLQGASVIPTTPKIPPRPRLVAGGFEPGRRELQRQGQLSGRFIYLDLFRFI